MQTVRLCSIDRSARAVITCPCTHAGIPCSAASFVVVVRLSGSTPQYATTQCSCPGAFSTADLPQADRGYQAVRVYIWKEKGKIVGPARHACHSLVKRIYSASTRYTRCPSPLSRRAGRPRGYPALHLLLRVRNIWRVLYRLFACVRRYKNAYVARQDAKMHFLDISLHIDGRSTFSKLCTQW